MKMDFLAEGGDCCPMIRLFDYGPGEVDQLRLACLELAYGRITEFALHEQAWCEPVGGCRLIWRASPWEAMMKLPAPGEPFVLPNTREGWLEVEGILQPFSERAPGYNWLADDSEVNLLISWNGDW